MLRMIGAIMICFGSAAIGLSASNRLSLRIRVLHEWLGIMDMMHSEIKFLLTPLCELWTKCAEGAHEPIRSFFVRCIEDCGGAHDVSFHEVWESALSDCGMGLEGSELQIIRDLGNTLGRYDAAEQAVRIEHLRAALASRTKVAEYEKSRVGKLYGSLGVACGIALVIVFI